MGTPSREPADLSTLLYAMRGRYSSNAIDKVCAIAFPFLKRGSHNFRNVTFPIYDPSTPVSEAWERLISSITSTKMEVDDLPEDGYNEARRVRHTPTVQLLRLFPHPSRHHWFPSWAQVQQYPNVSVIDKDPVPAAGGEGGGGRGGGGGGGDIIDYSLRIMSGRIYRGCSLQLSRPPTPKKKATYRCSMGGNHVTLVATIPGVAPNIDSKSKYVLVDISPDHSLWPSELHERCRETGIGHEHPPIWLESVIIVCEEEEEGGGKKEEEKEEEDYMSSPQPSLSAVITRYRLRRVTTLEWDCREITKISARKWSYRPRHWLPFKPSLVHMRSILCSAEGGPPPPHSVTSSSSSSFSACSSLDVFCEPAAYAGLLTSQKKGRQKWRGVGGGGEPHEEKWRAGESHGESQDGREWRERDNRSPFPCPV